VIAEKADWKDLDNVRLQFPHADQVRVGSNRHVVVFNIGGNEYRLIAAIHYNTQTVYVLMIMTHAEYSKEKWKSKL
jgi:mRNA interferase HigB